MMLPLTVVQPGTLLNTGGPEERDIQPLFWQRSQSILEEGTAYKYVSETSIVALSKYVPGSRINTQEGWFTLLGDNKDSFVEDMAEE